MRKFKYESDGVEKRHKKNLAANDQKSRTDPHSLGLITICGAAPPQRIAPRYGERIRSFGSEQSPSGFVRPKLKLVPWWDPLRGDPCFKQIVASLAPK
jgi:hypothetical protein